MFSVDRNVLVYVCVMMMLCWFRLLNVVCSMIVSFMFGVVLRLLMNSVMCLLWLSMRLVMMFDSSVLVSVLVGSGVWCLMFFLLWMLRFSLIL